jgi:hypothetical protein
VLGLVEYSVRTFPDLGDYREFLAHFIDCFQSPLEDSAAAALTQIATKSDPSDLE